MLTYDDALNMNYYKKTSFTGWMGSLRYKIAMDGDETKQFHVWIWPAPYNFESTADELKQEAFFPFNEEGRRQSVDWVNEHLQFFSKQ